MKKSIMIGMAVLAAAALLTVASCGHQAPPSVPTETPKVSSATAAKSGLVAASVNFKLTNATPFSDDAVWKVYTYIPGGVSSDVSASVKTKDSTQTLILSHSTDIPARLYWVTVTETGPNNVESDKLQLEVTEPANVSATPAASTTTATKTNSSSSNVGFTLDSGISGEWKVYTNGTASATVKASVSDTALTLETVKPEAEDTASPLPAGTYWVTVTEKDKIESARLKLTVKDPA